MIEEKLKKKYLKRLNKIPIALIIGESTGLESFKRILFDQNKLVSIIYVVSTSNIYNDQIKKICKEKKINFFTINQFKKKNSEIIKLNKKTKILLSIYSSIILKKGFLKSLKYRCYNFHPGILPFYRGKNCVSGAIYNSEKKIGISVHKMNNQIDSGKIILQKKIKVSKDETLFSAMLKLRRINLLLLSKLFFLIKKNIKFKLKRNDKKRAMAYPKYIPNFGLIHNNLSFLQFKKMFNAGFSGPYENDWGKLHFLYKRKKKTIYSFKIIKIYKREKILKKDKNTYDFFLKDAVLRLRT